MAKPTKKKAPTKKTPKPAAKKTGRKPGKPTAPTKTVAEGDDDLPDDGA